MKKVAFLATVGAIGLAVTTYATASAQPAAPAGEASARVVALQRATAGSQRSPANRARDRYRHPEETLNFFEVDPGDTVVEIWPGGGWYTEILAPYLKSGGGRLIAGVPGWGREGFTKLQQSRSDVFGAVTLATFPVFDGAAGGVPNGSADVVLTFRNVHNWRGGAGRPDKQDYSADAFRQMYAMLKPGGVLGVTDHRLPELADAEREKTSGYIKVSTVRRLAEQAGFRFAGASEVNANPNDPADWPNGVWTLPPSLSQGEVDRARYIAIGESDRMTLKFVKPR